MKKIMFLLVLLCTVAQGAWATDVANETDLRSAITNGATITLTDDITLANGHLGIGDGITVTLDLNGHTLSRNLSSPDDLGSVIRVEKGGTLTVKDSSGDNSGRITGGKATNGGGITNHGTLYFRGGTITGCSATNGGGIFNAPIAEGDTPATMTMTGGVIDGCNGKDCGGIYNYKGCQLTITGGTIKNCSSDGGGGGVVNYGTATISGGIITGNHCQTRGGGVWNGESATMIVTGGTITGNRAEIHGGGVFSYSSIKMSGNPVITNNRIKNHKENLYLDEWASVYVKGAFTEGASIGITPYETTLGMVYDFDTYNPELDPNAVFSSDLPGYSFYVYSTTHWVLLTPQDPQTYITDVMVVGADDDDDADYYYRVYVNNGWTGIRQDLNNNAGGHYVYLLYKTNRSSGSSGRAISDFYLRVSGQYDAPSSFVRNGRTYYMAEYHGDSEFREKRGDLNCGAGGYWIHLYYTKDDGEYMGVNYLTINNSSGGALGENGGGTPCDLNKDAGGDDIFMHINRTTINKWSDYRSNGFSHKDGNTIYIENEAELALLANDINMGYSNGYKVVLNKDLDMSDHSWTPMGTESQTFRSDFDGNGHTISGIQVFSTGHYNGFFGYVQGRHYIDAEKHLSAGSAYIKNFALKDSHIEGRDYTAGVVGCLVGEVTLDGVVCQADVVGGSHVGGLVGKVEGMSSYNPAIPVNRANVQNCLFLSGRISASGSCAATMCTLGRDILHSNNYYADPASYVGNSFDCRAYPVTRSLPDGVTVSYTSSKGILHDDVFYSPEGTVSFHVKYDINLIVTVKVNGTELSGTDGNYSFAIDPAKATSYAISVTARESPVIGSGTEASPYLITKEADWDYYTNFLNSGQAPNCFRGTYFKLTADIHIASQMGTDDYPFRGIFDGDGHTLTIAFGSETSYVNKSCAPFYAIDEATIKNLMTVGSIYSSGMYNSGLACHSIGTASLIRNCVSSVDIYSNLNGEGINGGFIGSLNVRKTEGKPVTFEGCAFVGSLQGPKTYAWGGFVGFLDLYTTFSQETISFTDCLFAPTTVSINSGKYFQNGAFCGCVTGTDHLMTLIYDNCYHTQTLSPNDGGMRAYTLDRLPTTVGEEKAAYGFITAYSNGLKCGENYYMTLDVVSLADNAANSTVISQRDGDMANVVISGRKLYTDGGWNTLCLPFDVNPLDGTSLEGATVMTLDVEGDYNGNQTGFKSDGTLYLYFKEVTAIEAGKPYLVKWESDRSAYVTINSSSEWRAFANKVNNGTESCEGKIVRLCSDIDVSSTVGTQDYPFKGNFDGGGHTLIVSMDDTGNQGTAPFRYISDATIANVKTTGTVKGSRHCTGLVGFAYSGTNTIQNCHVDVNVTATEKYVGGVLGHGMSSNTTVTDCIFTGSITGPEEANIGVFDAWNNKGSHSVENCLAAGTYSGTAKAACRNDGAKNCYSKNGSLADAADASAMGNEELLAKLGSGWEIVNDDVVPKAIAVNITNPVFPAVVFSQAISDVTSDDGSVTFKGTYDPLEIGDEGDNTKLYFSTANTLYWPNDAMTFKPFRAYFQLNTATANVRAYHLHFGDGDETTGIISLTPDPSLGGEGSGYWYSLDGRRLYSRSADEGRKPTRRGIYIKRSAEGRLQGKNGKKVIVK